MSPPNPPRQSPSDLRRKLLTLPPGTPTTPPVLEEQLQEPVALPPRMMNRRNTETMAAGLPEIPEDPMILNTMTVEALGAARLGHTSKVTPLPSQRLDPLAFVPAGVPSLPMMPDAQTYMYEANEEIRRLRSENTELRRLLSEMKGILEEASTQETKAQQREEQLQKALAEKEEQIKTLQEQFAQFEEQLANAPPPPAPKTGDELAEWADELERENARIAQQKRQLEQDRQQLREDEEALERQMRQMEVQMARERAMMARQETELKRLSAEIQHELELMERGDTTLREQLARFQRRHHDVLRGVPASPPPASAPPA